MSSLDRGQHMLHKKYFFRALLGATLLSCGFSILANAEQLPYEKVQITDPLELESMGLPPDAENVFKRVPRSGIKESELLANSFGNKDANFTSYLGRTSFVPIGT